ncbi:hypothetical protein [Mucilaginibacter celer]|uniref:Anti-sigma factor n=1 Tax=Mucilaginibacter celer TaxID=2305508 RepID=A0A494VIR5_9SPHI|nr:hypothetical protein [Mucilaginibacter celer]AYL94084.1 hypothetical protein HYN43_001690 [Mucilaginibacter celer]
MKDYIDSGILEVFVMGAATEEEVRELMYMKAKYPEVNEALKQLEADMEKVAMNMAIVPPPGTWDKIEDEINDLIRREERLNKPVQFRTSDNGYNRQQKTAPADQYIEVEGASSHMRLHKSWRYVFAAIFVLGKIFLGFAIYFYLENRQAQEQIKELKSEVKELRR